MNYRVGWDLSWISPDSLSQCYLEPEKDPQKDSEEYIPPSSLVGGDEHGNVSEDVDESEVNDEQMGDEKGKIEAELAPAHHASRQLDWS